MGKKAGYVRVSTQTQSNDRQVESLNSYYGDTDWELYADIGSGADNSRDDINRLIEDIQNGKIDKVVSWEISRIARDLAFASEFIETCVNNNVELITTNDMFPSLKGGDIMDKMMAQLVSWMMAYEREMIRERVISGVHRAINNGKWVGRPPYGFDIGDDGFLTILSDDYIAMSTAVSMSMTTDMTQTSIAKRTGVPQSSLSRILSDESKRKLYLFAESDDKRIEKALPDEANSEIQNINDRINEIEKKINLE